MEERFAALRARRARIVAARRILHPLRSGLLEQQRLLRQEREAAQAPVRLDGPAGAMIEAAPVGICVVAGEGTFAQVNNAYAALFGYLPHELVGRPFTVVLPPEGWEEGQTAFRRGLASAATYITERTLRRRDGTPVAVLGASIPVVGPGGRPQRAAFVVDISAHKAAEDLQARLAAVVASTADALIGVALDDTITSWSGAAERLYGYAAAKVIGCPLGLLTLPGGPDAAAASHAVWERGEPTVDLDAVRRHKDGSAVPVSISVSPLRDETGAIIGTVCSHRDIGARKAAEEALGRTNAELAQANADLETLLRVLPIGIGVSDDPAVSRIRMNPALARMHALPPEANASLSAPEGERPTNLKVYRDGRELAAEELPMQLAATTGREVPGVELEVVREDGVRLTQLVYAAPLRDEQGRVRGAVGAHLDISAHVLAERQRDILLAGMAHDLKNPLSALVWLAEALQRQATEPDEVRLLERFVGGARQILAQITDLVDTTRGQLGRPLELDLRMADLADLVGRLVTERARLHPDRRISVAGTDAPLPGLYDEARLARALANVLGNATKYSTPGGEVRVELSRAEVTRGWATIRVADRGIGIPAAEVGRVFEPFYRASNARPGREGSGLGLAGVRQVVEAHGGSVSLAGEEGVGTTVTLRLPLRPPGLPAAAEEAR